LQTITKEFNQDGKKRFLKYGCFDLAYASAVLGDKGLRFSNETDNMYGALQVKNEEPSWTLGAAYMELVKLQQRQL